ncbi:hypothetical protein [Acinetobacter baumannii]|uniref:hypothetical protein n=1 Tax=Acinetobacter baumannii TaxID=470 RepID=UPI001D17FD61|nr:hypothetical protein [Acinetobacter baumannii]
MDNCREEFEKHYLNLPFHDSKAAQKCLDSCDFDVKQNVYIPNAKWFDENDADEGVIYCCMLNTAYMSFQHQQAKVEELQKQLSEYIFVAETIDEMYVKEVQKSDELQKRVDAAKGLAQILWEKSNEKHNQGKVWESKALGECADEILDVLEQALKGEGQ